MVELRTAVPASHELCRVHTAVRNIPLVSTHQVNGTSARKIERDGKRDISMYGGTCLKIQNKNTPTPSSCPQNVLAGYRCSSYPYAVRVHRKYYNYLERVPLP